jgi:Cu(I)/Ag(I) efflux system membrane fusion protein
MSDANPNETDDPVPENSDHLQESPTAESTTGRTVAVAIAVVAAALLAFVAGRWTGGGEATNGGASKTGAKTGGTAKPRSYTCPMHPDVRSDDPDDTCPVCGMDLVPVKKSKGSDEGPDIPKLRLSDRALEVAKVRTVEAKRQRVSREIRTYGRVEPAEESETDLTAWVRGRIEHLDIRAVGQRIERGERIARLYSPKLESVQKELLQAVRTARSNGGDTSSARKRAARSAAEGARKRLRVMGMKPRQIDSIVEAGEARSVVDVYAETSGTVTERHAFEGDWVDVGDAIASLQGLDTVWIQLEIYERDLPFVEEGTPVTITLPNRPGVELESRIDFVDPVVDPSNGTARARVVASNADGELPPGTDVRGIVRATVEGDPPPISIPESAVLWTGPRSMVYEYDRSMQPPAFVGREVELGPEVGDRRIIRAGIEEGTEVAVQGAFQLDAELQIRGEDSMMTGLHPSQRLSEPVEVPEDGKEFKPAIAPKRVPDGAWYCPMDPTHWAQKKEGDGTCPVCGMNLEEQTSDAKVNVPKGGEEFEPAITPDQLPDGVYYCPMSKVHWAQPEEGDGQCPICGMNLAEKKADGASAQEASHGHDHEHGDDHGTSNGGEQ